MTKVSQDQGDKDMTDYVPTDAGGWLTCRNPGKLLKVLEVANYAVTERRLRLFALACAVDYGHVNVKTWRAWSEKRGELDTRGVSFYMTAWEGARFWCGGRVATYDPLELSPADAGVRSDLVREFFPSPFIRWRIDACLVADEGHKGECPTLRGRWVTPQTVALARAALDDGDEFGNMDTVRLAVLADSLEENGCDDDYLLGHLRGLAPCGWCLQGTHGMEQACGGHGYGRYGLGHHGWLKSQTPHPVGCWAVDMVLGTRE